MPSDLEVLKREIHDGCRLYDKRENQCKELATQYKAAMVRFLQAALHLGKKCLEAKKLLGHGKFMAWAETNIELRSHSTINRCMRFYAAYHANNAPDLSSFRSLTHALDELCTKKPNPRDEDNGVNEQETPEREEPIVETEPLEPTNDNIESETTYRPTSEGWEQEDEAQEHQTEFYQLSLSDRWLTPDWLRKLVHDFFTKLDLDPASNLIGTPNINAARHYTVRDNGLELPWEGTVYLNPPYGKPIKHWIDKLLAEFKSSRVTEAIALIPNCSDTHWHHKLNAFPRCDLKGRLKFVREETRQIESSATFASSLFYLGQDFYRFRDHFSEKGNTLIPSVYLNVLLKNDQEAA